MTLLYKIHGVAAIIYILYGYVSVLKAVEYKKNAFYLIKHGSKWTWRGQRERDRDGVRVK